MPKLLGPNNPPVDALRSFGLIVGAGFGVIGIWPALLGREGPALWVLALGATLALSGLLLPRSLTWAYRLWISIGHALGLMNSRVLLMLAFYLVVVPTGFLLRLVGRDSMRRRLQPEIESYRIARQARPASHMKNQF